MRIDDITLKTITDSRGDKTLEVEMVASDKKVSASVPSGKSKGSNEAFVLEPQKALEKFAQIKFDLLSTNFDSLEGFDNFLISLDNTSNKSNLGGNLMLVLSIGFTKLLAKSQNLEIYQLIAQITETKIQKFPLGFYNLIEGGVHAKNSLPFQEYLFVPQTASPKFSLEQVQKALIILEGKEHEKYGKLTYGDEGGFTVPSDDPREGLLLLQEVRSELEDSITKFSLDVAASALLKGGYYEVGKELLGQEELLRLYKNLASDFPLLSVEDPFEENDWSGFEHLNRELGSKMWIVGDDLTTTNPPRIAQAYHQGAINAVIIKPNQIGTMTETIQAATLAQKYGWKIVVSHRSGETLDTFIADLAVGLQADGLKSGCPLQKERLVKYQRLIEIEEML